MDMGERILFAHVEGNLEWLNVFLLTIVKDMLSEGAMAWFRPEGLMAAALLTLKTSDLLKEKSHGKVGMRESFGCQRLVLWMRRMWVSFPILKRFGMVRLSILRAIRLPIF